MILPFMIKAQDIPDPILSKLLLWLVSFPFSFFRQEAWLGILPELEAGLSGFHRLIHLILLDVGAGPAEGPGQAAFFLVLFALDKQLLKGSF